MVKASRRDSVIVKKIISEISEISSFIDRMTEDEFYRDIKTQKAVAMTLINIGELSKRFSAAFIDSRKNIPWQAIQATRNVVAHNYEAVDMSTIWDTVKVSLPVLQKELETSLSEV